MAKDPAFLFYPNDWIGGTMGMTFEEKGAYMELLMMQFNRGHMTTHMIGQVVGQTWDKIKHKFKADQSGLFYNERLELEIFKRANYSKSRNNNRLGKNQHTKNKETTENNLGHMTTHMSGHMENENINVNSSSFEIGVTGEKTFNTKPTDAPDLPEIKIGAAQELLKITKQVDVTKDEIIGMYAVFKSQHLTGENYYPNVAEIHSHFLNWIKKQNFQNGSHKKPDSNPKGTSAARVEALRNW